MMETTEELLTEAPAPTETTEVPTPQTEEAPLPETDTVEVTDAAEETEETKSEAPTDYAALAAQDLAEIKRLAPELNDAAHLWELPFAHRFAELRELGLSVREALYATMPHAPAEGGKAHLRSAVPRTHAPCSDALSPSEMRAAKDLFYGLSEKEINALYRRVIG